MKYIVFTLLLVASTLVAQDKKEIFLLIDSDKNSEISFKEIFEYRVKKDIELMKKQVEKTFKKCDKNADGKISKEEILKKDKKDKKIDFNCKIPSIVLDTMDLNKDGFLDKEEAMQNIRPSVSQRAKITKQMRKQLKQREEKIRQKYIIKRFEMCDKDKDEQLTLREATSRICGYNSDTFDELDKNLDELLSFDEINTKRDTNKILQKKLKSKIFQKATPLKKLSMALYLCDSDNDGMLSQDEAFYADCNIQSSIFKKYDFNKDGFIDSDENAMVREYRFFEKSDEDKNGYLDKEEFLKYKGQI